MEMHGLRNWLAALCVTRLVKLEVEGMVSRQLTWGRVAGRVLRGDEAAVGELLQLVARPRQVPHEVPVEARLLLHQKQYVQVHCRSDWKAR